MKRTTLCFALLVGVLASDRPAPAIDLGLGILNKKKPKADPPSRAKLLLETLRTDPDESKRKAAATELRGLDPRNTPDLITGLVSSLQKDPSPGVRIEAAESIGIMKPISQPAGLAMEAAMTSDPDTKVRDAVKSALWQYHLNGYRTPPSGSPLATQTTEPPIAPKTRRHRSQADDAEAGRTGIPPDYQHRWERRPGAIDPGATNRQTETVTDRRTPWPSVVAHADAFDQAGNDATNAVQLDPDADAQYADAQYADNERTHRRHSATTDCPGTADNVRPLAKHPGDPNPDDSGATDECSHSPGSQKLLTVFTPREAAASRQDWSPDGLRFFALRV